MGMASMPGQGPYSVGSAGFQGGMGPVMAQLASAATLGTTPMVFNQ